MEEGAAGCEWRTSETEKSSAPPCEKKKKIDVWDCAGWREDGAINEVALERGEW